MTPRAGFFLVAAVASVLTAELCAKANDSGPTGGNVPAAAGTPAKAEPHFLVQRYEVLGNSLLPQKTLDALMSKHTGTNVTFDDISAAMKDLQLEYHARGYDSVSVTVPEQKLTNGIFTIRVFEGRLVEILVKGNHFYSSNNVMRALPGLKTNIYLNSKLFQPELDRANANQDRQVYPEIHPGPEPGTSALWLVVEDRLPLHAKLEANNQSSPGTPEQRISSSMVYNDLWQLDHSLGVQYSFSEEDFKPGGQWNFYDRPLVANYSGFYRLPLGSPRSMTEMVNDNPAVFGYNEATRKFELPAATTAPELNFYASRSTIDSGILSGSSKTLFSSVSRSIAQETDHQDLTINEGVGFRYSQPLHEFFGVQSHVQAGADLKWYSISSFETNNFIITQFLHDTSGNPFTRVSVTPSPVPATEKALSYLPLALRWDARRVDKHGVTDFGVSYSANVWFSGTRTTVESVAGSTRATGYWDILTGSLAREENLYEEWKVALRMDGQWSSEPLISNEQFGVGGINGVRGYREGEVFGDNGWRLTSELKTPTVRVGYAGEGTSLPLTIRASVFMDYAEADLLDPQGRKAVTPLWGVGLAGAVALGSTLDAHLGFAWPLLTTPTTEAYQLRVFFALSAQF